MENIKIKKSEFAEKLHKNFVLKANKKTQERLNFQAWLSENSQLENSEIRKARARKFSQLVEEKLG